MTKEMADTVYCVFRAGMLITIHKSRGQAQERVDRENADPKVRNSPARYELFALPIYE